MDDLTKVLREIRDRARTLVADTRKANDEAHVDRTLRVGLAQVNDPEALQDILACVKLMALESDSRARGDHQKAAQCRAARRAILQKSARSAPRARARGSARGSESLASLIAQGRAMERRTNQQIAAMRPEQQALLRSEIRSQMFAYMARMR